MYFELKKKTFFLKFENCIMYKKRIGNRFIRFQGLQILEN